MNLPNKLTVARMILIIPFVICMLPGAGGNLRFPALAIFIVASLTDMLDGYLARKNNLVTNFGKFMDPLADKLLVSAAMICLVSLHRLPAWVVIIIISREFAISGFRLIASDNGIVIAAGWWGKCKTVVQMFMIMFLIADFGGVFGVVEQVLIWAALILTIISMIDYILKNKQVLSMQS
ncbi:MAG: CDP-diacylglycerol--glycerol-3-phosphate 3-phosphatidyltransferase [Eubacteriales bacterium]|nr:CDP-diacylglycerol--glycerol-3-phosphate 3-phosphatidyltransferase [Eubacteriales bacterium]